MQHEVSKLRNDFETYLHSAPTVGSHTDYGSSTAFLDPNTVQGKVELLEQVSAYSGLRFTKVKNLLF